MALQLVEDRAKMTHVVSPCVTVNQNIIKEHQHKTTEERAKNIIHQCLERGWGIAQPKGHDQELVEAVVCAERRLVDVPQPHADLMIARAEVELGEVAGPVELIQQLVDHGDGERVFDSERVERPVVNAEAPRPVRLLDEEDRGRERGVAAPHDALLHHGCALPLQFIFVRSGVPVRPDSHRQRAQLEDNVVVAGTLRGQSCWLGEEAPKGEPELVQEGRQGPKRWR